MQMLWFQHHLKDWHNAQVLIEEVWTMQRRLSFSYENCAWMPLNLLELKKAPSNLKELKSMSW